jgi:hypothetical protein
MTYAMLLPNRHTIGMCRGLHTPYTATRHEPWGLLVVDRTTATGGVRDRRNPPPFPLQPRANTPRRPGHYAHNTNPHFSSISARVTMDRGGRCVPSGRRTSPSAATIWHSMERGCPPCPTVAPEPRLAPATAPQQPRIPPATPAAAKLKCDSTTFLAYTAARRGSALPYRRAQTPQPTPPTAGQVQMAANATSLAKAGSVGRGAEQDISSTKRHLGPSWRPSTRGRSALA